MAIPPLKFKIPTLPAKRLFTPPAQALAKYLINTGVPAECILTEECATATLENMTLSRKMLTERFGEHRLRLAVVTFYFHVVRSVKLAEANI